MANPATMLTTSQWSKVALAASVTGTAVQAYTQYQQGKAQEEEYKRNAAIAAQEAKIKEQEAEREREAYREQAREQRKEARKLKAQQITLYAKSGVKAGIGTPLIVSEESQKQMERQARIIQERGEYAYSLGMSEAETLSSKSSLYRKIASSAGKTGLWKAGSTLATGLSSSYLSYKKYKKA